MGETVGTQTVEVPIPEYVQEEAARRADRRGGPPGDHLADMLEIGWALENPDLEIS